MRMNGLQHGQTAETTGDSWRGRFWRQESYVKKHNTPGIVMPGVL
jgi:hypothetical protein